MPRLHPASANIGHDDLSRFQFFLAVRGQVFGPVGQGVETAYKNRVLPKFRSAHGRDPKDATEVRHALEQDEIHQIWSWLRRDSQDLLWLYAGEAVDRQYDSIAETCADIDPAPRGSLTLREGLKPPRYLTEIDTHRMPGNFTTEVRPNDLRAGAVYDLGSAVYQMGLGRKNGQFLNDGRGHTVAAYVMTNFPGFRPKRILDMGCSVGQSTLPYCDYFPDAELTAIDVGAPLLRYAHARAELLGKKVNFVQDDAEHSNFPDASFDLIVSHILFHETSRTAVANIMRETKRLLAPGGVFVHCENPVRIEHLDAYGIAWNGWEQYNNSEPYLLGCAKTDFIGMARELGFENPWAGFIKIVGDARKEKAVEHPPPKGYGYCWYLISGCQG